MALLHSWRHLATPVEKAELIELMLQWEGAAGLPERERQQLALDIERQARRLRFSRKVGRQPMWC